MMPHSRTSRLLFKLAAILLAGAILNVAVAWVASIWFHPTQDLNEVHRVGITDQYGPCWGYAEWRRFGSARIIAYELTNYWNEQSATPPYVNDADDTGVPSWCSLDSIDAQESFPLRMGRIYIEDARGWPLYSLKSWYEPFTWHTQDAQVDPSYGIALPHPVRDFISVPVPYLKYHVAQSTVMGEPACLQLLPVFPGFAVNSVVYASVLWFLLLSPLQVRRLIRRRRGLCPACGYRIAPGTGEVCSECGNAVTSRTAA